MEGIPPFFFPKAPKIRGGKLKSLACRTLLRFNDACASDLSALRGDPDSPLADWDDERTS